MSRELISVQGFYYTGSSAVIDLLKEFKNIQVLGFSEDAFDETIKYSKPNHEFIFHTTLGFNSLYKEFELKRKIGFDLAVKRFMLCTHWLERSNAYNVSFFGAPDSCFRFNDAAFKFLISILNLSNEDLSNIGLFEKEYQRQFVFPATLGLDFLNTNEPCFMLDIFKFIQKHPFSFIKDGTIAYKAKEGLTLDDLKQAYKEYFDSI